MKLIKIDKTVYRRRLNWTIGLVVATLAILSLVIGKLLISLFGQQVTGSGSTGNFHLNLAGVILALFLCGAVLIYYRHHPLLKEVYYVSKLKALQNRIYRRLKDWQRRANAGEQDALIILSFYYTSLIQVYRLDDNTLTLGKVEQDLQDVRAKIDQNNWQVSEDDFKSSMLKRT